MERREFLRKARTSHSCALATLVPSPVMRQRIECHNKQYQQLEPSGTPSSSTFENMFGSHAACIARYFQGISMFG